MHSEKRESAVGWAVAVCLVLLGVGSLTARADDEVPVAAKQVLAAVEADDTTALTDLALREHPNAWIVADALAAEGHLAVALAFARAADAPHLEGLAAWLERRAETEIGVASVLRRKAKGTTLRAESELEASAETFAQAAAEAEAIGWRTGQARALYDAGRSRYARGDMEEALAFFEHRLEVEEALDSGIGRGRAHFAVALTLRTLTRFDEARLHLERMREHCERAGDHEYLGKLAAEEAVDAALANNFGEALAAFDRALILLAQADASEFASRFRPSPLRLVRTRAGLTLNAASMAAELGDVSAWRRRADAALSAARASNDVRLLLSTEAQIKVAEGVFAERSGAHPEAADAYGEALVLYGRLDDRLETAKTLRRLGGVALSQGGLPLALDYQQQAMALATGIGAEREVARTAIELGSILTRMGRFAEAYAHFHRALDQTRELGARQIEADVLARLGHHYSDRADFGRAESHFEEALALQASLKREGNTGAYLLGLANCRRRMADPERALGLYAEAERRLIAEGDDYRATLALTGRATIHLDQGHTELAAAEIEEVLLRERERENAAGIAHALFLLGSVEIQRDRPEAALARFTESRDLRHAQHSVTREVRATLNVAYAHMWLGQTDDSRRELDAALALTRELESPDLLAHTNAYRALHHIRLGENQEALRWSRLAAAQIRLLGMGNGGGQDAMVRAEYADAHEVGADAARLLGDAESLFLFLESGRSVTLVRALGGRTAIREAAVPERHRLAEEEARLGEARALATYHHLRRNGRRAETRAARDALRETRETHARSIQAIQREERVRAAIAYAVPAALAEIQAALADDEALVLYALPRREILALVVTREATRIVNLGSAAPLTEEVDAFLPDERPFVNPAAAARLEARLLGPLGLGKEVRRLLVSPDGRLAYLPFALLAGDREVVCVPSATTYLRLGEMGHAPGEQVLAFGNPNYGLDRTGAVATLRSDQFLLPLPATEDEVKAVGDVVRIRGDATETRLRREITGQRRWRAVHLACHGMIDVERPDLSALALGADAENDGLLTVLDVLRMNIPADLAVLSGCETGRGKIVRGEGILGLTRAFMAAGAPAVLVSLWPVDDEATQAFMTAFYAAWNPSDETEGVPAATALKAAQAYVKGQQQWQHPRFWAAWTLWGHPR